MILYLSSGTDQEYFTKCQNENSVTSGFQAQKFNRLVIEGLGHFEKVISIANLPFDPNYNGKLEDFRTNNDNIEYIAIGNNKGVFHKLKNILKMTRFAKKAIGKEKPSMIVCDAINPLASLVGLLLSKKYKVNSIAIVTDIPEFMSEHQSLFSRLTSFLLKKYDGYVLLTKAMNNIVNRKNKPFIIMEGLCDVNAENILDINEEKNRNILYTGSLFPGTGIEELIDAVLNLEGVQLTICGNGPLSERIKTIEAINFLGCVTNDIAVDLQRKSFLLVNPRPLNLQYNEYSFPSKIMEYMVSGTPVLSTCLPGIPEDYYPFIFFCGDSANEIRDSIANLLEQSKDVLHNKGVQAREFVIKNKNNVAQAKRIIELSKNIAK